jgi:hypothetical protein
MTITEQAVTVVGARGARATTTIAAAGVLLAPLTVWDTLVATDLAAQRRCSATEDPSPAIASPLSVVLRGRCHLGLWTIVMTNWTASCC